MRGGEDDLVRNERAAAKVLAVGRDPQGHHVAVAALRRGILHGAYAVATQCGPVALARRLLAQVHAREEGRSMTSAWLPMLVAPARLARLESRLPGINPRKGDRQ